MTEFFKFSSRSKQITFGIIGLGALFVVLSILFGVESNRIWSSFVMANWYFLAIALGGLFIIAVSYISKSGWNTALKRIPEAMSSYIPWALLIFGVPYLLYMLLVDNNMYHWTHEHAVQHDEILKGKTPYLNVPFFAVRLVFVLVIWALFTWIFRKNSLKEDEEGGLKWFNKALVHSAIFIILFAITVSVASWDWMMSLEPHWFSTMYAVYAFAGIFVGGWAVIIITTIQLKNKGYLS